MKFKLKIINCRWGTNDWFAPKYTGTSIADKATYPAKENLHSINHMQKYWVYGNPMVRLSIWWGVGWGIFQVTDYETITF